MGIRENLMNWMAERSGAFDYRNDKPGKLSPDSTRYSDCSGTIYSAYASQGIRIGTMSYEQAENGRRIATGTTPTQFAQISGYLRPGDIVAMALRHGVGSGSRINHVEMYAGDGNSWGHGGMPGEARGPNLHSIYGRWLLQDAAFWVVQRIVEDEPTPIEEEEDMNPAQEAKLNRAVENSDAALRALTLANERVYGLEQKLNHVYEAADHLLKAVTQVNDRAYLADVQSKAAVAQIGDVAKLLKGKGITQ